jgi:adenylate cyclase
MSLRTRPAAVWAVPLAILVAGLVVLATDLGHGATRLRNALFDEFERSAPRTFQETDSRSPYRVRVLDADQASLMRFGAWPWPHAVLARLTQELTAAGAATVVFTFPLDVADPASPKNLLAEIPSGPDYDSARSAVAALPTPDDALAAAMHRVKAVTGFMLGDSTPARAPQAKSTVVYLGAKDPFSRIVSYDDAAGAVANIEDASAGIGALNLLAARDGMIRRMPMVFRSKGILLPSLDAEAVRVTGGKQAVTVRSDEGESDLLGGHASIASVVSEASELPAAPDGSLWIAWSGSNAARRISAAALDAGTVPAGALKNAIVYVGSPDVVRVPLGYEGVGEAHAEAMENILLGSVLRRPASADFAELIATLILGLTLVVMFARLGVAWSAAAAAIVLSVAGFASWHLYSANRVLLDALGPGIVIAGVVVAGTSARLYELWMSRLRLRSAFADALPFAVIEKIARSPALLKLDGESRTVTYLSCGIRGFAALSASFREDPASFTRLVQRVLTPLMDQVLSHGGAIDHLASDGFTAFWNAPLDDPEHAIHACEAASRMTERMATINEALTRERRSDGVPLAPVEIGIGIATGQAIAGGFRAHGRMAYSVNGDCAIVANRIQALSAQYGPAVIVSETTRKSSERGFAFLEVDYIAAGAHEEPVKLYAMLGNPVVRASPKFRALMTFHEHIFQSLRTQQWQKTRDLIEQCRKLSGASQKVYDLHLARVGYFEANPPGDDWDGAFRPILK